MICRKKMLSSCLLALLFSLFCLSSSVSAYSFGDVSHVTFARSTSATATNTNSRVYSYFNPTDGTIKRNFVNIDQNTANAAGVSIFNSNPSAGYVQQIELKPSTSIPAHSMFSFTLRFAGLSGGTLKYNGFNTDGQWTLLNDSCVQSAAYEQNSVTYASDFNCTYYGYTDDGISSGFLRMTGYIVNFEINGVMIIENGLNYVVVSSDSGGGSVDLTQLTDDVEYILGEIRNNNTQNSYIYVRLADIMTLLEDIQDGQLTQQNIETATANALADQAQAEAQALQDSQDDAQDDADDSQTAVQGATTSLLAVLGQFVSALTNANATNCNINGDLVPHLPLGQLNLCANSPPAALTALGSLILIGFIIPLAYSTVKRIIDLIGEFQR